MRKINNFVKTNANTESVILPGGVINFRVSSPETEDRVGVYENELDPYALGAPMHLHRKMEEIFHVIEGQMSIILDTEHVLANAGNTILIPRGTPHGFSNRSKNPLKFLLIFSPAQAREGYFKGMAELLKQGEAFDSRAFLSLMKQYDQELVESDDTWLTDFNDGR